LGFSEPDDVVSFELRRLLGGRLDRLLSPLRVLKRPLARAIGPERVIRRRPAGVARNPLFARPFGEFAAGAHIATDVPTRRRLGLLIAWRPRDALLARAGARRFVRLLGVRLAALRVSLPVERAATIHTITTRSEALPAAIASGIAAALGGRVALFVAWRPRDALVARADTITAFACRIVAVIVVVGAALFVAWSTSNTTSTRISHAAPYAALAC
jgi:hypothetical protein